jgi:hypothetical protein
VSETAVSATVQQAERDQHEAGDRGQLELDQGDEEPPGLEIRRLAIDATAGLSDSHS